MVCWPFEVKPQPHARCQFSLSIHVLASHQTGTLVATLLPMEGLNSHRCAQRPRDHTMLMRWCGTGLGGASHQRLLRLVAADKCLSLLFFPQGCLLQPSQDLVTVLSAGKDSTAVQPDSHPATNFLHNLCPAPGTMGFQVLPPIVQMINSFWHDHRLNFSSTKTK